MSEYEPGTPTSRDAEVLAALRARDGSLSEVVLSGGRSIRVWNIAWGYDASDEWAHCTTNISPAIAAEQADIFYTHEVIRVVDVHSGELLLGPDARTA